MGNLPGVVGWGGPETTKTELVKVWHGCFIRFSQVLLIAHSSVDRYNSAQGKTEKAFPVYSLPPPSPFPSPFPLKTFGVISHRHSSSTFLWQSFSLFWSLPNRLSQPPWSLSDWFVCLSPYLCLKHKHESWQPVVLHAGFRDRAQFLILGRHTLHWLGCFTMNSFLISQRKSPWLGSSSLLVWSFQNTRTVIPPSLYPACTYHHLHTTLCAMVSAT